uniref:Cytochrome c oxidase subunit 2 n=2 Tax=Xenos TaxID=32435 RepID=A0A7T1T1M4_9NEOP|nr:cytochrome c oxidase subunit II [Xenos yangi]QPP04700.1 cytochrome c oxidase subunit 2 [Xenos cf. moutoni RZ-2020]UXG18677.1 cytochrome c oxidase subunit 2 [Xenos yangi]
MYWNIMDSASPMMKELSLLNDHMITMMIFLLTWIFLLKMMIIFTKLPMSIKYMKNIEFYWSIIPLSLISLIAVPSIYLTYSMESNLNSSLTVKILGHQWYWSYEYKNFKDKEILSYLINAKKAPQLKFLEVDNNLILPYNMNIRLLTSSSDVIHSWTIQSLGIKMDAIPGHLNQMNLIINRPGNYYGQCSEICGINHSYMPICLESIKINMFLNFIS